MATIRDFATQDSVTPTTIEALGARTAAPLDARAISDQIAAENSGQLRRGWTSARISSEANVLAAKVSSLRAAGKAAEADALVPQITALQERAAMFAPAEPEASKLTLAHPGGFVDYALGQLGSNAAAMVDPIAMEVGANAAANVVGKFKHPLAQTTALGLRALGLAGAGAYNFEQGKGDFYNRMSQDPAVMEGKTPEQINNEANLVGGAFGVLGTPLPHIIGARLTGSTLRRAVGESAESFAARKLAAEAAKPPPGLLAGTAKDMALGGGMGVAQEGVVHAAHSALNPGRDTSHDTEDLFNTGVGGSFGGLVGAPTHLLGKMSARLKVKDDGTVGDDLSGKGTGKAPGGADGPLVRSMAERAAKERAEPAMAGPDAQKWYDLLSGNADVSSPEQAAAVVAAQHAALVKELQGRVERGSQEAQQHLNALLQPDQDPTKPTAPLNDSARMAARDYLVGDGTSAEGDAQLIAAYRTRKLNEQGVRPDDLGGHTIKDGEPVKYGDGKTMPVAMYRAEQERIKQRAKLTATYLRDSIPQGRDNRLKSAATEIANEVSQFGSTLFSEPTEGDKRRASILGQHLVQLYGEDRAQSVVKEMGRTAAVESAPLYKALAEQTAKAAADRVAYRNEKALSRDEAGMQLARLIPPEQELKLREVGVDLTTPKGRANLLDHAQDAFHRHPEGHIPEKVTETFGPEVAGKMRDLLGQRIEPNSKLELSQKERTSGKTAAATETDTTDYEKQAGEKGYEKAPSDQMYVFKSTPEGHFHTTTKERSHPFMPNAKGELPQLFGLGENYPKSFKDTKTGEVKLHPKADTKISEDIERRAYESLDKDWSPLKTKTERGEGTTRRTTSHEDPSSMYSVHTVSAHDVMDQHGLSDTQRIKLLRHYTGGEDSALTPILTAERRIKEMQAKGAMEPKQTYVGVDLENRKFIMRDNTSEPGRELQAHTDALIKEFAAKHGIEYTEGMKAVDLARRYFKSKGLVEVLEHGERDPLRLPQSKMRVMARRGADDIKDALYRAKGNKEAEFANQADMNLIRFKDRDGKERVMRASDIVTWVNDSQPERAKPKLKSDVARAEHFLTRLGEGIAALVADKHATETPYMLDDLGVKHEFADASKMRHMKGVLPDLAKGLPPDLKLGTMTVRELADKYKNRVVARRIAEKKGELQGPAHRVLSDHEQGRAEVVDHEASAEEKLRQRADIEKGLLHDERPPTDDESHTPLDSYKEQVGDEFTDTRNRTSALNTAMGRIERMTPNNALQRGKVLAEELLHAFSRMGKTEVKEDKVTVVNEWGNKEPKLVRVTDEAGNEKMKPNTRTLEGFRADLEAAVSRLERIGRDMKKEGQYAAPLAHVLAGDLGRLVSRGDPTEKVPAGSDSATLHRRLLALKDDVARSLADPDSLLNKQQRAQLAEVLMGGKDDAARQAMREAIARSREREAEARAALEKEGGQPGRKFNEQATPEARQAPENATRTDEEITKAKAHFEKTLGKDINTVFAESFPRGNGFWDEAKNLIGIATATGPGILTTAHHESMHALFSRLIADHPESAEKLARVMEAPQILARLKGLLHDSPKALEAIDGASPTAREERVAYAYQFWAAGKLEVDKPATTVFDKIRRMLRKVLGMVRESETALDIITAFHEGKLADRSEAGTVLKDIMARETWNEDVRKKFNVQTSALNRIIAPSNDIMRGSVSATLRETGKMFFSNPGEEAAGQREPGYLNRRRIMNSKFSNWFYNSVKGLNEKDMVEVITALQHGDLDQLHYGPAREAADSIRALIKRYHAYATDPEGPGLQLGSLGEKYFPRVYDQSKLIKNRDLFTKMLTDNYKGITHEDALEIHRILVDNSGVDQKGLLSSDGMIYSPFFASQKERHFNWIKPEHAEPFLEKDLVATMERYFHQGTRAAEYARAFGNGGEFLKKSMVMAGDVLPDGTKAMENGAVAKEFYEYAKDKLDLTGEKMDKWVQGKMKEARNAIAAQEGSLGADTSDAWRKMSGAMMVYQNLRLLPLSLFSAFADTVGIAARTDKGGLKLAGDAFLQGLKDVYSRWRDAASDYPAERKKSVWEGIAEMVGAVDSHMFLEQMGKVQSSEYMTDFNRNMNRKLFVANGLTAWDRSMRVSATKGAVLFIKDHGALPDKVHSERWLKELGLTKDDVRLTEDGDLAISRQDMKALGMTDKQATVAADKMQTAIVRWVEGAVLTPNAAQRPIWASDPRWAVVFHLKQFTYSWHHTVMKRALHEATQGNMNPIGALSAAVPTAIAADMVRGMVQGLGEFPTYMKGWGADDWIKHGVERGALAGVGQYGIDAFTHPASLGGPTVDQIAGLVTHPLKDSAVSAIPGVRLFANAPDFARVAD